MTAARSSVTAAAMSTRSGLPLAGSSHTARRRRRMRGELLVRAGQEAAKCGGGIDLQRHGRAEQPALGAEEVGDERGVDAGLGGDPSYRRSRVPLGQEGSPGSLRERGARGWRGPSPGQAAGRGAAVDGAPSPTA